jgi:quinol monooxygenase YgiN
MAVLVRMVAAGMDTAAYDDVSTFLVKQVKKQPGFMLHVGYPSPGGFFVEEVWESQSQFEKWLNQNIRPNVPDVQHEVIELHDVVQP